ncbi:MAG: WXG100 family type VII secretion target [Clostridium sp.]
MAADRDYLVELQVLAESILDYSELRTEVMDLLNSCKSSADGLYETGWTGESMDSFKEKFNKWLNEGYAFCENMNMLENALKVMYKNVSELKDNGGKLSSYL